MRSRLVKVIAQGGLVAALYTVLTLLSNVLGIADGVVQFRLSEALCILPLFTPAAIPGLFVGCLLSNFLIGCALWDVIFGALATLAGAWGAYLLRKKPGLAPLPTVLANMAIVPTLLLTVYALEGSWWFFALTVGVGEAAVCFGLGLPLYRALNKRKEVLHL